MTYWRIILGYFLILLGCWMAGWEQGKEDVNAAQWRMVEIYEAL